MSSSRGQDGSRCAASCFVGLRLFMCSFITVKSVAAYVDQLTQAAEADYDLDATTARHKGRAAI